MKKYLINDKAKEKLLSGSQKLCEIVSSTLGPKGRNVALDRKYAPPLITNDGVSIAREYECEDDYENMACKLIKEASIKTNDVAGDGTTTAIVLSGKLLEEGIKAINNGSSPILLNKGINYAKNKAIEEIKKVAKKVTTKEEIRQVAMISSQDEEIGNLISKAYSLLKGTNISLQDSKTDRTELVYLEGMTIDGGFISPYLTTNMEKGIAEYDECLLLLTDKKLNSFGEMVPLFEKVMKSGLPLVIICDDIDDETLSSVVVNKMRGTFNCTIIRAPLYGEKKLALLEDIASLTSTEVASVSRGMNLSSLSLEDLAVLKHIKVTKDKTTIIAKNIDNARLNSRKKLIEEQIKTCESDYDKEQLQKRLANLSGGIATILVGANTDIEQKEKKLRIEDAVSATASAIEQGIAPGGGVTLYNIADRIKTPKNITKDEEIGIKILKETLKEPLIKILENASLDSQEIIKKIAKKRQFSFGYDALNNKFCDMLKSGIIDPAKVTISALTNSVSVVTTMLTTNVLITDKE